MQECLSNNNVLMYSTHNEGKSVIAGNIIKTLKAKIYKKMRANDCKSYISYMNKLVDQYNNTCHHTISKNLFMVIILIWLKKLRLISWLLSLKLMMKLKLLSIKVKFLVKLTPKIGQDYRICVEN